MKEIFLHKIINKYLIFKKIKVNMNLNIITLICQPKKFKQLK